VNPGRLSFGEAYLLLLPGDLYKVLLVDRSSAASQEEENNN
jgi:hypothetical protein